MKRRCAKRAVEPKQTPVCGDTAMQWSAEIAMLDMWREMDKNVTNGEMQNFFRRHLQAAFDAGRRPCLAALEKIANGYPCETAEEMRRVARDALGPPPPRARWEDVASGNAT